MKFLVDAQLPPALAGFIRGAGHYREQVGDLGLLAAEDVSIWRHADDHGSIIVTKDEDFSIRQTFEPAGPRVVWLRVGNCSNRALIAWFQPLFPNIMNRIDQGDRLIEVV